MSPRFEARVPRQLDGKRLEEILIALLEGATRSQVTRYVRRGAVRIDGEQVRRTNQVIRGGSEVRVNLERARASGQGVSGQADAARREPQPRVNPSANPWSGNATLAEQAAELTVLFEDEHLVVVNKPAGLLTHGIPAPPPAPFIDTQRTRGAGGLAAQRATRPPKNPGTPWGTPPAEHQPTPSNTPQPTDEVTLADLVTERFGRLPLLMGAERPGIVHRLDRETSGLIVIVIAKTGDSMEAMRESFRERRVEKAYMALVQGDPEWEETVLDWDLTTGAEDLRGWREPDPHHDEQQTARTGVEVLERFGATALVLCHPETGRRHQIRVHLFAAGHPLIGDKLYLDRVPSPRVRELSLLRGAPPIRRHLLHAAGLAFEHPVTRESLEAEMPPPDDMQAVMDWMRERYA